MPRRAVPLLRSLTQISPSLTAAATFALSGAAFAVGNLLLARQMPTQEYATLALAVAVFIVASHVATLGLSQVVLRRAIAPDTRVLVRLLGQGAIAGVIAAIVMSFSRERLGAAGSVALVLVTACGTLIWVASAGLLRQRRKGSAYLIQTIPDWILLAVGLAALFAPDWATRGALMTYCVAVAALGLLGWQAHRGMMLQQEPDRDPVSWSLVFSTTAIVAASLLVIQLERLAVGFLLDAQALAMFSVLASIAVFPFRLVTAGTSFVLVPGLQRITDGAGRRRLVRHELRVILGVLVGTSALLCLIGPAIAVWITAGRYAPTSWLVLAACLAGAAKVCNGIPRAIITACGSDAELARLSHLMWLGLALSIAGAIAGQWLGLIGVLYGIAAGSILGSLPAMWMARAVLDAPPRTASQPESSSDSR